MGNATCKKLCGAHAAAISEQVDVAHIYSIYMYVCVYVCITPRATSRKMSRQQFSPSENLDCGILFGLAWLRLDIFIAFTRTSLAGLLTRSLSLSPSPSSPLQVPLGGSNPMTYI